jgi:5-carboxymethyl-2-hydroxymuconate isomerase
MPHTILEYTNNVDGPQIGHSDLFAELHRVLVDIIGVDVANCKSRATPLDIYRVGEGEADAGFVHLEIKVLEGRPVELLREVGERCLAVLYHHFSPARQRLKLQITVRVEEMEQKTYLKTSSE